MNVTLIFSVEVYAQVVEAYMKGLEKRIAKGGAVNRDCVGGELFRQPH